MARPKHYRALEQLHAPYGPAVDEMLTAQRETSQAARAARLAAEHAREIAQQERLRVAVRDAERSVAGSLGAA